MSSPFWMPEGFDWRNPDYAPVFAERIERLKRLREGGPNLIAQVKAYYADDRPGEFVHDWLMTFDPRAAERKLPTSMPFLLFPHQRDFIAWLLLRWRNREDALAEKSRDMGVSYLCCGFALWMWLFQPGAVVGFGSRKEEYVDDLSDPKSLFWKIRNMLDQLPAEFLPERYDRKKHATFMSIENPVNAAFIVGEAGDNIGRGNRTSIYFKDEAQPLGARILTPDGWSTMGEMEVGSIVAGPAGDWRRVTRINDAGVHPVFRVGFSDGTFAECSPNHLWTVDKVWGGKGRLTLRTHEIAENFRYAAPCGQVQYKYRVPTTQPVMFESVGALPIDPYVMGCMLGDGGMSDAKATPRITSADMELLAEVATLLPEGTALTHDSRYSYRIVASAGPLKGRKMPRNLFRRALEATGVMGKLAQDKAVPRAYLHATPVERLSLLQGLMDTDGSASGGVASFHTSSPQLADDMLFLVQALGGTATHNVKPDARGYLDMHVLHLNLPEGMASFRLDRKLSALPSRKHPLGRTITSMSIVGEAPVRCITVDAPDGMYLTDHCIVTHNSAFYMHPEIIDAALSQTSNCKIDVSTPNGEGNPFARLRRSGKVPVFTFPWQKDPRKGKEWYDQQRAKLDPVVLAQEVDIDYAASSGAAYISSKWVNEAMQHGPADVPKGGAWKVGVDVARFGDDKTVITMRNSRVLFTLASYGKLDTRQVSGIVRDFAEKCLNAGVRIAQIAIDSIGVGAGVVDTLKDWAKEPDNALHLIQIVGVNSSIRLDDGKNYNVRAFMWREMNDWLNPENGPVSLKNDPQLKMDLTGLRYEYRNGLLLIESKDDAKKRGLKSPDYADSLALTFAEPIKPPKVKRRAAEAEYVPFDPVTNV